MRRFLSCLATVFLLVASSSPNAQAQNWSQRATTLSDSLTNEVVRRLRNDFRQCGELLNVYRYDCYSKSYRNAAIKLSGIPDYGPAHDALRLVETRIVAVIDANLDPTRPALRQGFRSFDAVTEAALPEVKRETLRAMEDAQTILLRSPSASQQTHFSRIAAVIDSNKVLLRSALLQLGQGVTQFAGLLGLKRTY